MKVILGLGNPGRQYEQTRHNVGWWVLDHLADVWRLDSWRRDGESLVTDLRRGTSRIRLVKPQTFMNLSGTVLRPHMRREGWSAATDLLVVVDDVALPVGALRLRATGSSGGHNGLKSVEAWVGSRDYARLRIGIKPADEGHEVGDLSRFVLDRFAASERRVVREMLPLYERLVEQWLSEGVTSAMNAFNRKP